MLITVFLFAKKPTLRVRITYNAKNIIRNKIMRSVEEYFNAAVTFLYI